MMLGNKLHTKKPTTTKIHLFWSNLAKRHLMLMFWRYILTFKAKKPFKINDIIPLSLLYCIITLLFMFYVVVICQPFLNDGPYDFCYFVIYLDIVMCTLNMPCGPWRCHVYLDIVMWTIIFCHVDRDIVMLIVWWTLVTVMWTLLLWCFSYSCDGSSYCYIFRMMRLVIMLLIV